MKFLVTGDWHIDNNTIKTRKDNVLAACMDKIGQIFSIAQSHNCDAVLQPGDFFESHKANDFLKQYVIQFLKSGMANIPVYTVFGQHDLRYHSSNVNNTPLKVLEASEVVRVLDTKGMVYPHGDGSPNDPAVIIQGQSWYENLETDINFKQFKEVRRILVLHRMIVDSKIWVGQEDHTYGKILLKTTDYDLIVSGDNHKHFIMHSGIGSSIGKKLLINCGSLLRTRIDQEDHRPCVYVYNTNPKEGEPVFEQVYLIVDDFENVIRLAEAKKIKEENEKLKEFVKALSVDTQLTGINYKRNVHTHIQENEKLFDPPTKRFIDLVFEKLGG